MKLQDAYVAEAAAMGNWAKIGYAMKDGDSFGYTQTGSFSNEGTVLVESLGNGVEGWRATSKVKLNDCVNASVWKITVKQAANSAQGMVSYLTDISAQNCADLTPSFGKLASEANGATVGGN